MDFIWIGAIWMLIWPCKCAFTFSLSYTTKTTVARALHLTTPDAFLQELEALKDADSVYKIHGKVLIRQDISEAKSTVNSRIKLIQTEM